MQLQKHNERKKQGTNEKRDLIYDVPTTLYLEKKIKFKFFVMCLSYDISI